MQGCQIRAIWILNNVDSVVFSRRFPVVERQWRILCDKEMQKSENAETSSSLMCPLPTDRVITHSFVDRKMREGSVRGFGIRVAPSEKGSDSWVDDPITRYIISLQIVRDVEGLTPFLLWPLVLHVKSQYRILVLPMVEPHHLIAYERICQRDDCGNPSEVKKQTCFTDGLSYLLLSLPCLTGAFLVAQSLGDVLLGENTEPEIVIPPPSVGLLDSLTGSMGIASRPKPLPTPTATSGTTGSISANFVTTDLSGSKISSKPVDKDALRNFLSSAMPFGTPLDLSIINHTSMSLNGFSASDIPPADLKQPSWKPYLFKGKQRIVFMIHEVITAAMYDRDDIPDTISIAGQINCRADLEGLPDVSFPLSGLNSARTEALSFHPCAQVPEQGVDKQAFIFSPPLGNFVLLRYQALLGNLSPPVKGFYQLSMVSEDEGQFLFKLKLMEGYKAPFMVEFCTITMPFPQRRILLIDGNPSVGTVATTEHSVEWKIIASGRTMTAKSMEASFPGTIKFAPTTPVIKQYSSKSSLTIDSTNEDDANLDGEDTIGINDTQFLEEKMNKELKAEELEMPFSWEAYDYAKVSFKFLGAAVSGISIDTKSVTVYPSVKAPCETSAQVISGDYILWNSLGKCPYAASSKY